MQLSKNFFICTTLLSTLGCLVLGYQLYARTQAHKAQELLMVEVLEDCRKAIERMCFSNRYDIQKRADPYPNPHNLRSQKMANATLKLYQDFTDTNVSLIDIETFQKEFLKLNEVIYDTLLFSEIKRRISPKYSKYNKAFLEESTSLQKSFWKLKAGLALIPSLDFNIRQVGDNCWTDTQSKRVVLQPRNLSPNSNDDFEADIYLVSDIDLDMRFFANDKELKNLGETAVFKVPRKEGNPQETVITVYAFEPHTEQIRGAYRGVFTF